MFFGQKKYDIFVIKEKLSTFAHQNLNGKENISNRRICI